MDRPAELDGGGEVESEAIRPSFILKSKISLKWL